MNNFKNCMCWFFIIFPYNKEKSVNMFPGDPYLAFRLECRET